MVLQREIKKEGKEREQRSAYHEWSGTIHNPGVGSLDASSHSGMLPHALAPPLPEDTPPQDDPPPSVGSSVDSPSSVKADDSPFPPIPVAATSCSDFV